MKALTYLMLGVAVFLFSCKSSFHSSKTKSWSKQRVGWSKNLHEQNELPSDELSFDASKPVSENLKSSLNKLGLRKTEKQTQQLVFIDTYEWDDLDAQLAQSTPPDTNEVNEERGTQEPDNSNNSNKKREVAKYAESQAHAAKIFGIIGTVFLIIPFIGWFVGMVMLIIGTSHYVKAKSVPYNTRQGAEELRKAKIWLIVGWAPFILSAAIMIGILIFFLGEELGYW